MCFARRMSGPYPVLVLRTPYGKSNGSRYAQAGYIVVTQDARGRYQSDGVYESFVRLKTHDAEDGYDTVEWAAKLPRSTGKVGTYGASYNAFLQWRLAPLRPPSLVAMSAHSIPARMTDLEGPGTIRPGRRLNWWYRSMSPDMRLRANGEKPHSRAEAGKLWTAGKDKELLYFLPWLKLPDSMFGTEAEPVKRWLRNPHVDPWRLLDGCPEVAVPNFDVVGWFDHCNGSINLHRRMVADGKTKTARERQRLIIGPWSHSGRGGRKVGDVDFGETARFNIAKEDVRWFDYWLKGKDNGIDQEPPVSHFCDGRECVARRAGMAAQTGGQKGAVPRERRERQHTGRGWPSGVAAVWKRIRRSLPLRPRAIPFPPFGRRRNLPFPRIKRRWRNDGISSFIRRSRWRKRSR